MMHYFEAGNPHGPALVCLHGWGASKEIWHTVVRAPLTTRYRIIALDFPGTGLVKLTGDVSPSGLADWVLEQATLLGIGKFALMGHSMGGNVATHLAIRHPASVSALLLANPALQSDRLTRYRPVLDPVAGVMALEAARAMAGMAGWLENRMVPVDVPGWGRGYMRRSGYMSVHNTARGLQMQLRGLISSPANLDDLPVDLPVLILHGALDTTIPVTWAREAARTRPRNTQLIVYRRAQHCPMDTHTHRFVEDVAEFLEKGVSPNRG